MKQKNCIYLLKWKVHLIFKRKQYFFFFEIVHRWNPITFLLMKKRQNKRKWTKEKHVSLLAKNKIIKMSTNENWKKISKKYKKKITQQIGKIWNTQKNVNLNDIEKWKFQIKMMEMF